MHLADGSDGAAGGRLSCVGGTEIEGVSWDL